MKVWNKQVDVIEPRTAYHPMAWVSLLNILTRTIAAFLESQAAARTCFVCRHGASLEARVVKIIAVSEVETRAADADTDLAMLSWFVEYTCRRACL